MPGGGSISHSQGATRISNMQHVTLNMSGTGKPITLVQCVCAAHKCGAHSEWVGLFFNCQRLSLFLRYIKRYRYIAFYTVKFSANC